MVVALSLSHSLQFTQFRVFFPRPTIAKDAVSPASGFASHSSLPPSLPPSVPPSLPPSIYPSLPPSIPPSLSHSLPPSLPNSLTHSSITQVHNFLSTRLTSLAGLTDYIKRVFRQGSPHKNWPPILQLPGEIRPPETDGDFKPNFVAYQVLLPPSLGPLPPFLSPTHPPSSFLSPPSLLPSFLPLSPLSPSLPLSHPSLPPSLSPLSPSLLPPPSFSPPSLSQITTRLPFEIDMVFETGMFSAALSISGERFTNALQRRVTAFDDRFENTFQLQAKVGGWGWERAILVGVAGRGHFGGRGWERTILLA